MKISSITKWAGPALILFFCFVMFSAASAADDPLSKLSDTTLSYFKPLTGSVTKVEGKTVSLSFAEKVQTAPGTRMKVLREGAPFVHPVTKEVIGKVEAAVGKVEIREVLPESVVATLVEGDAKVGDKVRISDTKIKIFFCQDKKVNWYLADEYYRRLKTSGKTELIDTDLETTDEPAALAEAKKKGAEVALLLSARTSGKNILLKEKLFWVADGTRFAETEASVSQDYATELSSGAEFFTPRPGDAVLKYELPFGAKFVAFGDLDGDGKQELILATDTVIRVYRPGNDLQFLWEVKTERGGDNIWLETTDLGRGGKEGILVTTKQGDSVISRLYELEGDNFKKILQGNYFIRKAGRNLLMQAYSASDGFTGDVRKITLSGEVKTGEKVNLPRGVNLYDFALVEGADKEPFVLAYDENGYLNLYDQKGTRVWRSASDSGGFLKSFKKQTVGMFRPGGEWTIKDRLFQQRNEVMAVRRVPVLRMAKGIGYKKSVINKYWWNGFSMEETPLIDGIPGTLLDYSISGDELIVLASPFMGIKFENILKGENPLGSTIFIYKLMGGL